MAKSVNTMQPRFGRLGRYQAGDLLSQVATAELSGAGQMIITVSRELTVNITGPGTVSYSGDASVEKSITGVGQLIKR